MEEMEININRQIGEEVWKKLLPVIHKVREEQKKRDELSKDEN